MAFLLTQIGAPGENPTPYTIFVPVRAVDRFVVDNGGDTLAVCPSSVIAQELARLLNKEACTSG